VALGARAAAAWAPQADWRKQPVQWARQKLAAWLWSKQQEILQSIVDNRYTAVKSCHGIGKSYTAAAAACWWLDAHPPGSAFVVTTAPTDTQVKAILWREIQRLHKRGKLLGRITEDAHWKLDDGELIAYGRKPADKVSPEEAMQAFQGIHALYVLVILDEACGVPKWLYDAADSLATNDDARVLAIGNPDNPSAEFANVCKPGSGWHVIKVGAWDTPNFTGEPVPPELARLLISQQWVQERAERWGTESSLYVSKVLGEFPKVGDDTLIEPSWVIAAQQRTLPPNVLDCVYGVDVARFGKDKTIAMLREGYVCRVVYERAKQSTMTTANDLRKLTNAHISRPPFCVDDVGIGGAVTDRLRELGHQVHAMIGNAAPTQVLPNGKAKFNNIRSEWFWNLRELLETNQLDLDEADDELAAQLSTIRYALDKQGRICVESKENMERRGLPSPDRADALAYACALNGYQARPVEAKPTGTGSSLDLTTSIQEARW
jgi:hypothetical protein